LKKYSLIHFFVGVVLPCVTYAVARKLDADHNLAMNLAMSLAGVLVGLVVLMGLVGLVMSVYWAVVLVAGFAGLIGLVVAGFGGFVGLVVAGFAGLVAGLATGFTDWVAKELDLPKKFTITTTISTMVVTFTIIYLLKYFLT